MDQILHLEALKHAYEGDDMSQNNESDATSEGQNSDDKPTFAISGSRVLAKVSELTDGIVTRIKKKYHPSYALWMRIEIHLKYCFRIVVQLCGVM